MPARLVAVDGIVVPEVGKPLDQPSEGSLSSMTVCHSVRFGLLNGNAKGLQLNGAADMWIRHL